MASILKVQVGQDMTIGVELVGNEGSIIDVSSGRTYRKMGIFRGVNLCTQPYECNQMTMGMGVEIKD